MKKIQAGGVTQLLNACLVYTTSWVQDLAPYKLGVVVHAYNPSNGRSAQQDQEFEATLSYIESLRPIWPTQTLSQTKNEDVDDNP